MTPPPATSSIDYDKFEEAGRILFGLAEENKELRGLAAQVEEFKKYKDLYTEKCVEYDEERKENKRLKAENKQLKQQLENSVLLSDFLYNFDATGFNEGMTDSNIKRLMDFLLELAETPLERGYLIETSKDIIPVYIILSENNVFYKGKPQDNNKNWGLATFCYCWNNNVVTRVTDEERRKELLSDYNAIKGELSKEPWKGAASCSWRSLYDRCESNNGRNSTKKGKLRRAVNIQRRMEELLKQIPALKSKKY